MNVHPDWQLEWLQGDEYEYISTGLRGYAMTIGEQLLVGLL